VYQGVTELKTMEEAVNYNHWLFSQAEPFLGQRVLEIGCGIGTYLAFASRQDRQILGIELDEKCLHIAKKRYAGRSDITLIQGDINDERTIREARAFSPDSAYCLNVLEHIEDDQTALLHIAEILNECAPLILIVPAFPFLYGANDRLVGHFRRYTKQNLSAKLVTAGFEIYQIYYLNSIGFFAWFLLNRVFGQEHQAGSQISIYDRLVVPFLRRAEGHWHPPFGQSLVAVAKRGLHFSQAKKIL